MQEIKEKVHKLSKMLKKVGVTHQELSEFVGIKRPQVTMALHIDPIIKVWDGAECLINQRIKELQVWEKNEETPNCY